ncbi:hypothetical protein N2152v2_002270 [Parachlorella kessleri]
MNTRSRRAAAGMAPVASQAAPAPEMEQQTLRAPGPNGGAAVAAAAKPPAAGVRRSARSSAPVTQAGRKPEKAAADVSSKGNAGKDLPKGREATTAASTAFDVAAAAPVAAGGPAAGGPRRSSRIVASAATSKTSEGKAGENLSKAREMAVTAPTANGGAAGVAAAPAAAPAAGAHGTNETSEADHGEPQPTKVTFGESDLLDLGMVKLRTEPKPDGGTSQVQPDTHNSEPAGTSYMAKRRSQMAAACQAISESTAHLSELAHAAELPRMVDFMKANPDQSSHVLIHLALKGAVVSRLVTAAIEAASSLVRHCTELSRLSTAAPVVQQRSQQLSSLQEMLLGVEGEMVRSLVAGDARQAKLPDGAWALERTLIDVQAAAVALAVGASPSFDAHVRDGMCGYALVGVAIAIVALAANNTPRPSVETLRDLPYTVHRLVRIGHAVYSLGWRHLARWLEHLNPDELAACSDELKREVENMPSNRQRLWYCNHLWAVLMKENVEGLCNLAVGLFNTAALSHVHLAKLGDQRLNMVPKQPLMPEWMVEDIGAGMQLLDDGKKTAAVWIEAFTEMRSGAQRWLVESASSATQSLALAALALDIVTTLQLASDTTIRQLEGLHRKVSALLRQVGQSGLAEAASQHAAQVALAPMLSIATAGQEFREELRKAGQDMQLWEGHDFDCMSPEEIQALLDNKEELAAMADYFAKQMANFVLGRDEDGDRVHKTCWLLLAGGLPPR